MSTPVPALERAIGIVDFLAASPERDFTLSDISRGVEIHKATCLAILNVLATQSMVTKGPDLRYSIGPGFLRYTTAFGQKHAMSLPARSAMWDFHRETGLSCSVSVLEGKDVVVLDIAGDNDPIHLQHRIGRRFPLVPPQGTIFVAWDEPEVIDAWLQGMVDEFGGDKADHLQKISDIRARGYALGSEQDFNLSLDVALEHLAAPDHVSNIQTLMQIADKIRNYAGFPEGEEPVNFIIAPIFDRRGTVSLSLNAFGAPGDINRKNVARYAETLTRHASRVSLRARGASPVETSMLLARD